MKRLKILTLTAFVGIGLLAIGCGESGDTGGTTREAEPAASAPAEASAPATEPEATGEPSEAGADDEGAVKSKRGPSEEAEVRASRTGRRERRGSRTQDQGRRQRSGHQDAGAQRVEGLDRAVYGVGVLVRRAEQRVAWRHEAPPKAVQYQNQFQFSHANGDVEVQMVKSFPEPSTE
jgi:hypothetical protein